MFDTECMDQISVKLAMIPAETHWTTDPLSTDVGKEVAEANNPGRVPFDAPLLILQGDADIVVVPARTDAYFERVCATGQNATLTDRPRWRPQPPPRRPPRRDRDVARGPPGR